MVCHFASPLTSTSVLLNFAYGQMLIKLFVFCVCAIQSKGRNEKEVDGPQESISLDPLQRMEVSSHYVGIHTYIHTFYCV